MTLGSKLNNPDTDSKPSKAECAAHIGLQSGLFCIACVWWSAHALCGHPHTQTHTMFACSIKLFVWREWDSQCNKQNLCLKSYKLHVCYCSLVFETQSPSFILHLYYTWVTHIKWKILLGSHKIREKKQVYCTGKPTDTVHCESIPIHRRVAADQYFKGWIVWQKKGFLQAI